MIRLKFKKKKKYKWTLYTVSHLKEGLHNNIKTTGIGKYGKYWKVILIFLQR